MFEAITQRMDGGGVWDWVKNNLLGMFLPAGVVGMVASFVSERFGADMPSWARPVTDKLAGIWNFVVDAARGFFAKEELAADKGMTRQINGSSVFENAARAMAPSAAAAQQKEIADDLRAAVTRRISANTGFSMSVDIAYAVKESNDLNTGLQSAINKKLRELNSNWDDRPNSPDTIRFNQIAQTWAGNISGVTGREEAADINPNRARPGYLGMLLAVQKAVAAEGTFHENEVATFTPGTLTPSSTPSAPASQRTPAVANG